MKKKVYYKLNRYQVTKVEVETAEQEQAVKMLNREMDRFTKSEDTYYEKCSSLDEMYEESGFEPADDNPNPEEQFIESERQSEIKKQVHYGADGFFRGQIARRSCRVFWHKQTSSK